MKVQWQVSASDVRRVKDLVAAQRNNALVRVRLSKNCAADKPRVQKQQFWKQMVCMRLTSQQNSSPEGPVGRFARAVPFPLSYETVCSSKQAKSLIARVLRDWRGIRFVPTIADQLAGNFDKLEQGEWERALEQCNRLTSLVPRATEVEVASYIQNAFLGFGPKQSRNLLQALALTRFEIPIDSRVTDWLNEFGFPVHLSATALGDINYYNFVSDGIQELCSKSDVLPCVLDAAIFSLRDGESWTDENAF